jgi:hypothetical protein
MCDAAGPKMLPDARQKRARTDAARARTQAPMKVLAIVLKVEEGDKV